MQTNFYNYNVYVGKSLKLKEFFLAYKNQTLFIITDRNIYQLYQKYLEDCFQGFQIKIIVIEPTEESKSFVVYNKLLETLLAKGIRKSDLIIAFGGGVVGDLAGFVAGTILRGIQFVNIPTSLLAMTDSCIGGKTGINTSYGKNLVGLYKQPSFVIVDTFYLKTLPSVEYINGMAEVIKTGLIASTEFVNYLLTEQTDNQKIIIEALNIKKKFVAADPYEENIRMLLNFGHTFGHAIEKYHDYKIKHGYCVAMGMDLAIRFGIKNNITNQEVSNTLKKLYNKYGLNMFKGDANVYLKFIKYDKKNTNGSLNFVVLEDVGKAKIIKISEEDLNELSS